MKIKREASIQERRALYTPIFSSHLIVGVLLLVLIVVFGFANRASASLIFTNYSAASNFFNNGDFDLGTEFTVGSDALRVTSLGVWDLDLDGLPTVHSVGIWRVSDKSNTRRRGSRRKNALYCGRRSKCRRIPSEKTETLFKCDSAPAFMGRPASSRQTVKRT